MKLTSKGRYAVLGMLDLAANLNGSPVRLVDISERQSLSLHYLEQIFRRLRIGGVVKSVRGPGGGYLPAKELNQITIQDVLASVGESMDYTEKLPVSETSSTQAQVLNNYFGERVQSAVQNVLANDTLNDLLGSNSVVQ